MHLDFRKSVAAFDRCLSCITLIALTGLAVGCASKGPKGGLLEPTARTGDSPRLEKVERKGAVELRLMAVPKESEVVDYYHISASKAFEGKDLRHEKTDVLSFKAQAETTAVEPDRFTQKITVTKKDGTLGLHDFAMPEPGETLVVTSTNKGKILKAGDWPSNSIFYVAPVSLPEGPVEVGDTWAMQGSWLSLEDMVPYELDMVSILKGFVKCGADTCADIEINGGVAMQGVLKQQVVFRSEWRGRMLFSVEGGTVVWSRINSEEIFAYDQVYRKVGSCLEAALSEPAKKSILPAGIGPGCGGFVPPTSVR